MVGYMAEIDEKEGLNGPSRLSYATHFMENIRHGMVLFGLESSLIQNDKYSVADRSNYIRRIFRDGDGDQSTLS